MRMRALVAGLTGQLGTAVAAVAEHCGVSIVPLVRRGRRGSPPFARAFPAYADGAVDGDVTQPDWGLDTRRITRLARSVDAVVNLAGATDWAGSGRRLYEANQLGARYGFDLTRRMQDVAGQRIAYCYASSIFAAGGMIGTIPETPLPVDRHRTAYEQSKWLAEHEILAVSTQPDAPPVLIARICALLGDSATGATLRRNALYLLAERWSDIPLRLLPAMPGSRVDALPRDIAATTLLTALGGLTTRTGRAAQALPGQPVIVHVAAGEQAPTLRSVLEAARACAPHRFDRWVRVVPARAELILTVTQNLERFADLSPGWRNSVIGLRYVALDRVYERARLAELTGGQLPDPPVELLARLLFDLPRRAVPQSVSDPGLSRFLT
jgi:nucleoside-diphosphate-sugar epimerase